MSILFSGCSKIDTEVVQPTSPPPPPTFTPSKDRFAEVVLPDIPKTTWEPIFHESIDARTKVAGIGKLREMQLADADVEVRIWGGFGLTGLVGFVLSRKSDEWSAISLHYDFARKNHDARTIRLHEPPAGWRNSWESLLRCGLLTLPDSRSIKCDGRFNDGFSYVVEIKKGPNYRTYMYDNPGEQFENRCKEADEMVAIAKIVGRNFGAIGFEK